MSARTVARLYRCPRCGQAVTLHTPHAVAGVCNNHPRPVPMVLVVPEETNE